MNQQATTTMDDHAIHGRPKRQWRSTQNSSFIYPDPNHNLPIDNKKAKEAQKAAKQLWMKTRPETLMWDHKTTSKYTSQALQCAVLYYGKRQMENIMRSLPQQQTKKPTAWRQILGGEQLIIKEHIHTNFYNTGIVLIQGKNFVQWGDWHFHTLKQGLNNKQTKEDNKNKQLDQGQQTCD